MWLLFEIGIIFARILLPEKDKDEDGDEGEDGDEETDQATN